MKEFPNKVKYSRPHKIRIIKGSKGFSLSRFNCGVRLKSSLYVSYKHLEIVRRTINRIIKPKGVKNKKNLMYIRSSLKKYRTKTHNIKKKLRAKKKKFLFVRSNLCLPLTKKPLQVRMGKGKGSVNRWVYPANKSRVIFEMSRQKFKLRKIYKLFTKSSKKMPFKFKFIYHRLYARRETIFKLNKNLLFYT